MLSRRGRATVFSEDCPRDRTEFERSSFGSRGGRWCVTTRKLESASRRVRLAAFLLIAGLVAGPIGTHVYWMLGGTWGLGRSTTTIGIQLVAAAVVVLLV